MKASQGSRRCVSRLLLLSVACGLSLFCSQPRDLASEEQAMNHRQGGTVLTRAMSSNASSIFAQGLQ